MTDETTVEIGGQTMTEAQYRAAQAPVQAHLNGERRGRRLGRIVAAVLIVLAFLLGALVSPPWAPRPAHAAARPVYKGTVTICYAPAPANADPQDQYLTKRWAAVLPGAVKAAQPTIGKVRVVTERYPHSTCYGEVSLWSATGAWANRPAKPYDVYKYGEGRTMWESQITMGAKVGAKATAAQRQAWLTAALKVAIPR